VHLICFYTFCKLIGSFYQGAKSDRVTVVWKSSIVRLYCVYLCRLQCGCSLQYCRRKICVLMFASRTVNVTRLPQFQCYQSKEC